jgi:LysR family cys regulon transcriptional activator
MQEIDNLKKVSDEFARRDEGSLVIACTHTQARYVLPKVIPTFRQHFPKVHLSLAEGSPPQLAQMVLSGQADLAVATESLALTPGLETLPCYVWEHAVVVKSDHPLAARALKKGFELTLEHIASYPIVTYDKAFSGRLSIDRAFEAQGIRPDVVLEAIDADVIKTYVDVGLGIGIIAGMAYEPARDSHLVSLPAGHLFGEQTTKVALKSGVFLRDYVYTFIAMLNPELDAERVRNLIENKHE